MGWTPILAGIVFPHNLQATYYSGLDPSPQIDWGKLLGIFTGSFCHAVTLISGCHVKGKYGHAFTLALRLLWRRQVRLCRLKGKCGLAAAKACALTR